MPWLQQSEPTLSGEIWLKLAAYVLLGMLVSFGPQVAAQTYSVIHDFTGCGDGDTPTSTLIWDRAGNLYGSTELGGVGCGSDSDGVVFQLKHAQSGWTVRPLQEFVFNEDDLAFPLNYGGLTFGPDGNLYGTTQQGGLPGCGGNTCGAVFRLQPPPRACTSALCPWSLSILHEFNGSDGGFPEGSIIFDAAGNIYGTSEYGSSA